MKKLLFSLIAAFAFTACQNTDSTPKSTENTTPSAVSTAPADNTIDPTQVQAAAATAQTSLNAIKEVTVQIDALPDKVKKEKAAEIEELRSLAEGITEKQTMMIRELASPSQSSNSNSSAIADGGATTPDPVAIKSNIESINNYSKEVEQMQQRVKALSGKQQ